MIRRAALVLLVAVLAGQFLVVTSLETAQAQSVSDIFGSGIVTVAPNITVPIPEEWRQATVDILAGVRQMTANINLLVGEIRSLVTLMKASLLINIMLVLLLIWDTFHDNRLSKQNSETIAQQREALDQQAKMMSAMAELLERSGIQLEDLPQEGDRE